MSVINDRRLPAKVVVIAAGAGGPQALAEILPQVPSNYSGAIIVAQHMRPGFTRVLANHLNELCRLPVYEPVHGQVLQSSEILIVPGGSCLTLSEPGISPCTLAIEDVQDDLEAVQTRMNRAMASVAAYFGRLTTGIVLTGAGIDARDGIRAIADSGGITIAQDEASSIIFDMPSAAIDSGSVHYILPPWNIAEHIISSAMGDANANAA